MTFTASSHRAGRQALRVLLAAGSMLVLGALATPAQAQIGGTAPVRIGVVGPLTGPSGDFGVPMLNGIKLAVDEINAVGGYLGRPLELALLHKPEFVRDAPHPRRSYAMACRGIVVGRPS